jgi:hypothetical protein
MTATAIKIDREVVQGIKPLPARNHATDQDQENGYVDIFRQTILDQKADYPAPIPVISIVQKDEVIPFLTLKSFSLWQGKQKSKKTTALAVAIAAFISDHGTMAPIPEGTFFKTGEPGVVLFFDTEQGQSFAARTMRLILNMAGLSSSVKLIYCDLREHSPADRWKIIIAGIESIPEVKIVVIDGLVDLLNDFMDAGDGHTAITEILRACSHYNIHVCGVLHQNKNDKNVRAHVGSIASQKCEMEISTEVDPQNRCQSIVSCVNSRGLPFEPFAIVWNKGELPRINNDCDISVRTDRPKTSKYYDDRKRVADTLFKPLVALRHTDAKKQIATLAGVSERTAIRMIDDMETYEFIEKGPDDLYRRKMQEVTSDTK